MAQLWYVPHHPDLLLLAPCDEDGPVPRPGAMYVSVDHLRPPERSENKWRHPSTTAFLTCYGDIGRQQPRVVRCACGQVPCKLRVLREGSGVPDELIPSDWATNYQLPPNDATQHAAPEGRRANAVQLWLDCTAKAERELPRAEGREQPEEERVLRAAEVMLTDYLKGRVCYSCHVPSTKMQKCARCRQARYCSKECQRAHWGAHKAECTAPAAVATTAASPADGDGTVTAAAVPAAKGDGEKAHQVAGALAAATAAAVDGTVTDGAAVAVAVAAATTTLES